MEEEKGKKLESQPLQEALTAYTGSDFYPYHMPGHKRQTDDGAWADIYRMDITEIDGFDNLHHPEGILRDAQERAARLYGAEETFFLVNGSTCGVLASILAVTERCDTLLIARNCHQSVYHAAFLQELNLHYLYPERMEEYDIFDAVSPEEVKKALKRYPECAVIVITSPTYEGVISDIGAIGRAVHEAGKVLIVDEAHGAHLGLAEGMPDNAVRQGADLVIHSLHKMLPALTQTALLHVNGTRVNRGKLRRYLRILQSSSPSYVLMAGMDHCIYYLEKHAAADFFRLQGCYQNFIKKTESCRHLRIGRFSSLEKGKYHLLAWDICKLVISTKGTSIGGVALYGMLRDEFHLQMEMAAESYVLAIMTIADKEEGWQRLADALLQIDGRIESAALDTASEQEFVPVQTDIASARNGIIPAQSVMSIAQAVHKADRASRAEAFLVQTDGASVTVGNELPLTSAAGRTAGSFITPYPPGVPLLVPGERIGEESIRQIQSFLERGIPIYGISERGTVIIAE